MGIASFEGSLISCRPFFEILSSQTEEKRDHDREIHSLDYD